MQQTKRHEFLKYIYQFIVYYSLIAFSFAIFATTEFYSTPRYQDKKFQLTNKHISKSYVSNEVISGKQLLVLCTIPGLLIIVLQCFFGNLSNQLKFTKGENLKPYFISKKLHFLHLSLIAFVLILNLNGAVTNVLKLVIGNLRPDFIARCMPDPNLTTDLNVWYNLQVCTQPNKAILFEGLKSTPSGHSSFVTCSLGFLYFWQKKFINGPNWRNLWCIIIPIIVMVSRLTDHRHHWYDVLFGSSIGGLVIYICWSRLLKPIDPYEAENQEMETMV
ncbi:hypothetical protein TBLA_0A05220 [Henningerozyma blattae CBS 6284]|uniref:Phosphatidic acid phosphatase type 2/haloperoxidase domain-containing protein n=1 Tax=Henningerozyma blattae (strain ATCC 34711 / CBS 6284 / DSM 70876 / NBRC 10599 / NRRL Y-10934 / UCD 77-7) TaxID=1071380 RepID=I2GW13_HENB6|nr:hypothetical protein TBLA_0A05220 [Tetrapisispora blattae CBS 6284]CCH58315.1 hypothetical protein TBLA_0A05220 [Tetrapisispora blattae CBS 6284]